MAQSTVRAERGTNAGAAPGAGQGAGLALLRRIGAHLAPWLAPLAILLAWEFAARSGILSTRVLPEPLAVVKAAWSLIQSGEMWADVKVSTWRAVSGFAIGGGIGLVLGLATGLFKPAGVKGFALYRHVVLPGALPSILVGVRFAFGLMWVTLIVAETISAQSGIGYMTMNAREFLQTDVVVVGILLYAALGKLADVLAKTLERVSLRWHPAYQRGAKV